MLFQLQRDTICYAYLQTLCPGVKEGASIVYSIPLSDRAYEQWVTYSRQAKSTTSQKNVSCNNLVRQDLQVV